MGSENGKGTALITGASAGIGAAYADRLARRGYDLILVARSAEKLEAVARAVRGSSGRRVDTVSADLADRSDLLRVEQLLKSDQRITALVNNAGSGATSAMIESDPDQLEAMILLNVVALTRLSHAAATRFAARGAGLIINIASIVALDPLILNGTYSGTKAFVLNLSQSLHNELGDRGVQIQAVLPGATATEFWTHSGLPVENLPPAIVMSTDDMVDAALAGLDQRELVTIPALPDLADWTAFDAARLRLAPQLSRNRAAKRYQR